MLTMLQRVIIFDHIKTIEDKIIVMVKDKAGIQGMGVGLFFQFHPSCVTFNIFDAKK